MPTLNITEIHPNHDPAIVLEALNLMAGEVWGLQSGAELDIADKKRVVVAHTPSGAVLAAGALMLFDDGLHGSVAEIATHQAHRGEGLGRKVLTMLETLARDEGALEMSATPQTAEAKRFFEHFDYRPIDPASQDVIVRHTYSKEL